MKKFVCSICGYVYEGEAAPETMAVKLIDEVTPAYSSEVAEMLGLTLPEAYANATDVCAAADAE